MDRDHIRIGIIGLHGYGKTYFDTIGELPFAEVYSLCDSNEEVLTREAAAHGIDRVFSDYREMLLDPSLDAVFIATPHYLHYPMTMDALRAGKHVFCEKPLAMNTAEAEEMARCAESLGLLLSCHYNRRQSAPVKLLKDAVKKGALGEVYAVDVKWMARYTSFLFSPESAWRTVKSKAGGGILIGRGSHMLDAALYILGNPKVHSISANICSRLTRMEIDDYCFLMLRLENGSSVTVECSYENNIPDYSEKIEYRLFGTKAGAYSLEEGKNRRCLIGRCEFPKNEWVDLSDHYRLEEYETAYPDSIVKDFLRALHENAAPMIDGEQAAGVTKLLDAAYRSAAENREIVL